MAPRKIACSWGFGEGSPTKCSNLKEPDPLETAFHISPEGEAGVCIAGDNGNCNLGESWTSCGTNGGSWCIVSAESPEGVAFKKVYETARSVFALIGAAASIFLVFKLVQIVRDRGSESSGE